MGKHAFKNDFRKSFFSIKQTISFWYYCFGNLFFWKKKTFFFSKTISFRNSNIRGKKLWKTLYTIQQSKQIYLISISSPYQFYFTRYFFLLDSLTFIYSPTLCFFFLWNNTYCRSCWWNEFVFSITFFLNLKMIFKKK